METFSGGCHCKNSEYSAEGPPHWELLCHCIDCRVINGGGRLSGMGFSKENFVKAGEMSSYTYKGGSGKEIHLHFCAKCGTHLFAFLDAYPDFVVIRANTLSDPSLFSPKKSIYPESAFKWDHTL